MFQSHPGSLTHQIVRFTYFHTVTNMRRPNTPVSESYKSHESPKHYPTPTKASVIGAVELNRPCSRVKKNARVTKSSATSLYHVDCTTILIAQRLEVTDLCFLPKRFERWSVFWRQKESKLGGLTVLRFMDAASMTSTD